MPANWREGTLQRKMKKEGTTKGESAVGRWSERRQSRLPSFSLNPNRCILCCQAEETLDLLFLHCPYTGYLDFILDSFNLSLSPCIKQSSERSDWSESNVVGSLLWSTWLENNNRIFANSFESVFHIWEDVKVLTHQYDPWNQTSIVTNYDISTIFLNWSAFIYSIPLVWFWYLK